MRYRVRSQDGEIECESFDALKDAFDQHLVDPDDEILEEGSTHWRKASSYPQLVSREPEKKSLFEGPRRWYLMSAFVLLVGVGLVLGLRHGLVGFALVLIVAMGFSSLMVWSANRSKRTRPR